MELTKLEYQLLVEQAPIMIWRSDTTKLCNYFNNTWLDFTGKTLQQEVGNGWAEGVHPEDFDRCLKIYVEAFDKREIFEMDYRLMRHDGEYRWIFDRGVPFYDQGEFQGYIGSCIDIHEAKLAEEELERINEEKISKLNTLIPICAWCRKIKTEKDYWEDVEGYLRNLSGSEVTHTICHNCTDKESKKASKLKSAELDAKTEGPKDRTPIAAADL